MPCLPARSASRAGDVCSRADAFLQRSTPATVGRRTECARIAPVASCRSTRRALLTRIRVRRPTEQPHHLSGSGYGGKSPSEEPPSPFSDDKKVVGSLHARRMHALAIAGGSLLLLFVLWD